MQSCYSSARDHSHTLTHTTGTELRMIFSGLNYTRKTDMTYTKLNFLYTDYHTNLGV